MPAPTHKPDTTLTTEYKVTNYSTPPTTDVVIQDHDRSRICAECGGLIALVSSTLGGEFAHLGSEDLGHRATPVARCYYCGADGTVTFDHTHSYHDSADCSRCGGSLGYPLGD